MNCNEYREQVAADPSFDGGGEHVSGCIPCREYRDEMMALDLRIARALVLPVPELEVPELPDIDTDNVVALPARRRFPGVARYAIHRIPTGFSTGSSRLAVVGCPGRGDGGPSGSEAHVALKPPVTPP